MDKSFLDPIFKKFSFKQFYMERSSWGNATLTGKSIADNLFHSLSNNQITLQHNNNAITYNINGRNIKVILKPFNRYNKKVMIGRAKGIYTISKTIIVEIFVFNIFQEITGRNYSSYSNEELTDILVKYVHSGNVSNLISVISHEIQHAIEISEGKQNFTLAYDVNPEKDEAENYKAYINAPGEIHALIVEKCSILNTLWQNQLTSGKWLMYNRNRRLINFNTLKIINDADVRYEHMSSASMQKFKKGIFTTIQFLWEQYHQWAIEKNRTAKISQNDLSRIVNNQGTLKSQKSSAPVPPPLPRK